MVYCFGVKRMIKKITAVITVLIMLFGMSVFASANSTQVAITDAKSFKASNLSGNVLIFPANVGSSVIYKISGAALESFYYDSDVKFYNFTHGDYSVKADKNGYFGFKIDFIEFKLSTRAFTVVMTYKDGTSKEITETVTDNIYTVTADDITEFSVAKFGGNTVNCIKSGGKVLEFKTPYTGAFKVEKFGFSDVAEGKWYYEYINKSGAYGILSGVGDGKFEPQTNITRAQLATMIVKATSSLISYRVDPKLSFADVAKEKWYSEYIAKCATMGLMNGTGDNKFEPDKTATRQEIAAVVARVIEVLGNHGGKALPVINKETCATELGTVYKDAGNIQNWAKEYVLFCYKLEVMIGDSEGFRPKSNITRAECAKIFWLIFSENV